MCSGKSKQWGEGIVEEEEEATRKTIQQKLKIDLSFQAR